MRVYLSHSYADRATARKLAHDLVRAGVDVVSPDQTLKPGDSMMEKIPEAIESVDAVLVLLSRRGADSDSLLYEIAFATSLNLRRGRPSVVPVLLEPGVTKPAVLTDKVPADFSDAAAYESELRALVLRLEELEQESFGEEAGVTDQEVAFLAAQLETLQIERLERERARVGWMRRVAVVVIASAVLTCLALAVFLLAGVSQRALVVALTGLAGFLAGFVVNRFADVLRWRPLVTRLASLVRLIGDGVRRGPRGEGCQDE
jgi:hypothetical protein